jgi:2-methylisocitrate lyase-like PEP mutase family enzyme
MSQSEKASRFAKLHVKGNPLILYNAWDAGSAKTILEAGAKAIATSSWAVAAAQGYADGEQLPVNFAEQIIARIAANVDAPVTADFEGGYSDDDGELAENISRLLDTGIIGINFEDRVVKGKGLYPAERQARRIASVRNASGKKNVELFINARTDIFFEQGESDATVDEALERSKIYADAGASGLFVPGLQNDVFIDRICERAPLPINLMIMDGVPSNARLAELGLSRISYGPIPYIEVTRTLRQDAEKVLS